jgi:two-component system, cell cycle sensor histidine kinase and response regulator CckA
MMCAAEQQPPGHREVDQKLVFVVDDEAMIGDVVQIVLRMEGFRPRVFQNPEQALEAFAQEEIKPALLLTDYLMTPINGMQLIERCKQILPELKTILYSGNAGEQALHQYSVKPDAFLRKPFLPRTLMSLLRSTLNLTAL